MRIVLIGTAFPLRGGIAHYIALLYNNLKKKGHTVKVLSFKRQYPGLFFPGKTQKDEGKELISIESAPILDSVNPITWIKAFFWLKNIRPQLLIFKYWMPFFAPCYAVITCLCKKFLKVKSLYILDNVIPHEQRIGDKILTRIGLKYIDFFIAQSESVLKDLLQFRPDADYKQIPHPVYEIFPPSISKNKARRKLGINDDRVILYFGFIRDYKGVKYLIKAMPLILDFLKVKLLICGEFYEGRQETLRLIEEKAVINQVIVYDRFIPNEEVGLYFSAADLVVLPYVSATQSGIVQIAYHYEKPVLVTSVGGLPEVVKHEKCGYVVKPQDPVAIAEGIKKFYKEDKETEFSKNIKIEKKKYSWDRMTGAVEEFMTNPENE
ncbi:MAG: glycosyltransferase [bacterium]